jgi:hypothetical protein
MVCVHISFGEYKNSYLITYKTGVRMDYMHMDLGKKRLRESRM